MGKRGSHIRYANISRAAVVTDTKGSPQNFSMLTTHTIDSVYPWGRSLDEYVHMFSLTDSDRKMAILDCGGGPASFCAEMAALGNRVVACDPLYAFCPDEIERRIEETYYEMVDLVRRDHHRFVWDRIKSPEHLGEIRLNAMAAFIEDLRRHNGRRRYVIGKLPSLPFTNSSFGLALVSHLLFLYSEQLDTNVHVASLVELLRVADEVRIFPLVDMKGNVSVHVDPVIRRMKELGHTAELRRVDYEYQKGGHTMLVCRS
jgi:hypothetical protein